MLGVLENKKGLVMNRFIIADTPQEIAQALCDKHVVKMPLEEAQMLCTVVRQANPEYADEHELYRVAHAKHPCTLWAMETRANYTFAFKLYDAMLRDYNWRYEKIQGASKHWGSLWNARHLIPEGSLTPHPQCFSGHDELKTDEAYPIVAYRAFYAVDKLKFARYSKGREMPVWLAESKYNLERSI